MKKLLVLIFSLIVSVNSYANDICYADIPYDSSQMLDPKMLASTGTFPGKEIKWEELLTVCNVGDVVSMMLTDYSGSQSFEDLEKNGIALMDTQFFIQRYCDLRETVIINNFALVCRLVELRKQK